MLLLALAFSCATPASLDSKASNVSTEDPSDLVDYDDVATVDYSNASAGLLVATYWRDGEKALRIEAMRGGRVDRMQLDESIEVPDYVVNLRMILPSGQVVYQEFQDDLPVIQDEAGADATWDENSDVPFVGEVVAVDSYLLSDAAAAFADELEGDHYSAERLIVMGASEHVFFDEDESVDDTPPPPPSSCSGSACDGKDPVDYGCDSTGVNVTGYRIGYLYSRYYYLRWSTACETNWGKWKATATYNTTVYVDRYSPATTYSSTHRGTLNYSDMVYCPSPCLARARVTEGSTTYSTGYY